MSIFIFSHYKSMATMQPEFLSDWDKNKNETKQ